MSGQSIALLQGDLTALSKEAGRRHSDVRDAADKACQHLKTHKDHALDDALSTSEPPLLYQPIFLASATRNAKVIALAVSALQRLITAGAVPAQLVGHVLDTLEQVLAQGVEIQLKILQTLVSLLTTKAPADRGGQPLVKGEQLGRALELSHRLSTSKIPVVASTASATLRQLFMFVYDRIVDEDALVAKSNDPDRDPAVPRATFDVDVPPVEEDRAAAVSSRHDERSSTARDRGGGEGDKVSGGINEMRSIKLRPAARDAYLLLEDLCLLIAGSVEGGPDGEPSFLRWTSLSRTFGLELVESIVSGFGPVVRTHPELLLVLRAHLCPLLIRFLSSPPSPSSASSSSASHPSSTFSFPLTLRLTRVVFLLLKQFSDLLTLESEVFLTMFVRIIAPAADDGASYEGGHPAGPGQGTSPLWMRVLALEIFRGLCGDFELMTKFYQRYDAAAITATTSNTVAEDEKGKGKRSDEAAVHAEGGSTVFSDLMTAFNRLATERPAALGTGNAVLYGSSMGPVTSVVIPSHHQHSSTTSVSILNSPGGGGGGTGSTMIDSAVEMGLGLAHAAGSVVGSGAAAAVAGAASVGFHAAGAAAALAGLDVSTASMKLQCIDQLDKADPPAIPETYVFLLALQCLVALADGFSTFTLAKYASLLAERAKLAGRAVSRAPGALEWRDDDNGEDDRATLASLRIVKEMAETSWPALLASLSFFIATNVSDDLFTDVVAALEQFTCVCGVLNLSTPREAFLTSLCKFAIPPAVVSHIAQQDQLSVQSSKPMSTTSSAAATATAVLSAGAESLGLTSASAAQTPVGLSSRNLACLRALLAVSHYLAGSLGKTWFSVFEALQNAEFVLRASASSSSKGNKKRSAQAGGAVGTASVATNSSSRSGGGAGTGASNSAASGGATLGGGEPREPTKFPAVPTEADEQAIQRGIAALFEVSKSLEDEAFTDFVGALCRLNGEMIGFAMNPDGTVKDDEETTSRSGISSPVETPEKTRRRSSGISVKSHKSVEKSVGISKLGVVALFNVQRLVSSDPRLGWNLVTSHLLVVLRSTSVPTSIRLQAADVLDSALVLAPKNLSALPHDVRHRAQTQVLAALAAQAEPAARVQTSTDVDIRRVALESLLKILETHGHAFIAGWDRIFHVLRTACPWSQSQSQSVFAPPSPQTPFSSSHAGADPSRRSLDTIVEGDRIEPMTPLRLGGGGGGSYFPIERSAKTSVLVRTSFPSLQLICSDFLGGLEVEDLRNCIGTLAEFGRQADDVNVALTAGGLLWSVSDHVQAKRRGEDDDGDQYGDLWMFLLHQLLSLSRDPRQEVRDAAITNIFRSISMYGTTLSSATWGTCCHEIMFPLVDDISCALDAQTRIDDRSLVEEATVPQAHGPPIRLVDKQWDDSKTLVLRSMGDVFFDYLAQIVKTERYEDIWSSFVGHLRQSFVRDRPGPATAALQSLEKVLTVSLESAEASRITSSWQVAWSAWDEIGTAIEANSKSPATTETDKVYTQVNLEAFVRAVVPIYTPPYLSFDLAQISRLLSILKSVLTYARSPDYRADVDGLMPLQSAILEVVAVIKLDEVPGAASAVLTDLSEYLTLAFVAPFEAPPDGSGRIKQAQRVTYIALTKEVMPHVLWLYQKYRDDTWIYEQGAVEKMISSYALPMRLKHDCSASAKFGSAEPLWRSATVAFLKAVRDVVATLRTIGNDLPYERFVEIWRAIVEGIRGALLADTSNVHASLQHLHEEENFDLSLLLSVEQDVLPYIGTARVPDDLIRSLGHTLQLASRLYELDLPKIHRELRLAHKRSFASSVVSIEDEFTPPSTPPEARFDLDYDRQAKGAVRGTTVEVVEVGRERFAYWSFDLLFSLCSDEDQDYETERRRIAALCLPRLLSRCASALKTYVADAPLRGRVPFPRVRQEELVYVLQKLTSIRLREGTLWASAQSDPSSAVSSPPRLDTSLALPELVRSTLLRSRVAHLYELHSLFTSLVALASTMSAVSLDYVPYRDTVGRSQTDSGREGQGNATFEGLPPGFSVRRTGRSPSYPSSETTLRETDALKLVLSGLEQVGTEIGAGQSF